MTGRAAQGGSARGEECVVGRGLQNEGHVTRQLDLRSDASPRACPWPCGAPARSWRLGGSPGRVSAQCLPPNCQLCGTQTQRICRAQLPTERGASSRVIEKRFERMQLLLGRVPQRQAAGRPRAVSCAARRALSRGQGASAAAPAPRAPRSWRAAPRASDAWAAPSARARRPRSCA